MSGALSFLLYYSWKNRLLTRIRRLKQPKYLLGALVGGLYFFYIFGFQFFIGYRRGPRQLGGQFGISPENLALFEALGALALCGIVFLAWVLPHERAALIFSEAEIAFLFPAPVNRQTLIHYKLLKSQLAILFTTMLFTLVFGGRMSGSPAWVRAASWWMIFSTLNLHFLASSFARTMLLDRGISNWKRRIVVLALVAAAAGGVGVWAARTVPPPAEGDFASMDSIKYYVTQAAQAGPLPWLLYPFRLVVRPYLAPDALSFLKVAGPAFLLLAGHYWWVVRTNVAFEEASVEASQKVAERIAVMRANRGNLSIKPKKKKRPPFKLRPIGMPAVALLWKNLIGAGQLFSFRLWFFVLWLIVIGLVVSANNARAFNFMSFLATMSLIFLPMSFLIGPQLVRADFRQDLPMADVLKSYPLKGWQVALGEMLAPAAILTGIQWLLIVFCAGLAGNLGKGVNLEWRLAIAAGLAVMAPALNLVTLIIPNAAVVLFPGWFQTGKDAPQGIEVMGQRMIFALGQFAVFLVAMVPATIMFVPVLLLTRLVVGPYFSIPIAAAGAALVMGLEAWAGILWLGKRFERFDLSTESQ